MDNIRSSEWLLFMALLVHLIMAPFTKVEESFNIQAIHDILYHNINVTQYDHNEFPGVVPRTFFGSILVGSLLLPFLPFFNFLNVQKYWMLFTVRFIVGLCVVLAFSNFCRCIEKRFGRTTGTFLRLITATQFHFMFYASRTLPNTFALILVLLTFQKLLDREFKATTSLATFATFLFRFELILLFGPIFLVVFACQHYSPLKAIPVGIVSAVIALVVSIPLDSFLWGRWLWPEGEVLWFNIILNRSNEYGVSSFWWYFVSAMPRAFAATLPLVPLGFLLERRALTPIVAPAFSFIFIYSFLPHKELRFILYAFPLLNLSAAVFCARLWDSRNVSCIRKLFAYVTALHLLANFLVSATLLYASARNYPGGDALGHLQFVHRYLKNKPINVYIDSFCAETGVNRFLHLYPSWNYNKTENLPLAEYKNFDYILLGSNSAKNLREIVKQNFSTTHKEHFVVEAFHNIHFKSSKSFPFYVPVIRFKKKVIVLKKTASA